MNILKDIGRLSWRFGTKKAFLPNQEDINALNSIITWVNREKEQRINENRYFGKLAIYCLMREIEHFKDTKMAERKLHNILELPLEYWYDRFRLLRVMRDFNETKEMLNIQDVVEIWDKHKGPDGYLDMEAMRKDAAENKKLMAEHQDVLLQSLTRWEQSEINGALNYFISELLNEHGNKA